MSKPSTDTQKKIKKSRASLGPLARPDIVRVNPVALDVAMTLARLTSVELARATGYSESYVSQIRSGIRRRVAWKFLRAAGEVLAPRIGRPDVIAAGMILSENEEDV